MCRGGIRGLGPAFNQQLINFVHILGREFDRILVNCRHRRQVDARRGALSAFGQLKTLTMRTQISGKRPLAVCWHRPELAGRGHSYSWVSDFASRATPCYSQIRCIRRSRHVQTKLKRNEDRTPRVSRGHPRNFGMGDFVLCLWRFGCLVCLARLASNASF
jgi:hypothetical protein